MYHPRFKGTHYEMGLKMGKIFKACGAQFPVKLDPFQKKFGRESGKLLKKFFPEAAEEIRGITDTIEFDNELFTSWMMCMGCCMYNLEEMESVELRGCTAFAFTAGRKVFYGRDNDLPPFLGKISKSEYYRPAGKSAFILNTSSFINGEEGINCYGFTAAMTFVLPKLSEIKPGLNSVFIVRYLLENCRTVEEGIAALRGLPVASACNILMADKEGNMAVAECHPEKINIRLPEKTKTGDSFVISVNHFTSDKMKKYEAAGDTFYSSERYNTAYEALKTGVTNKGAGYAKEILSGKKGFMCQYGKELNFDTVWSSVFDITGKKVYRAEGNPGRVKYIEDKRLNRDFL